MFDVKRKSIVTEKDGTISIAVDFIETDTGFVLGCADSQGSTIKEAIDNLEKKIKTAVKEYNSQKEIENQADQHLNDLKFGIGISRSQ